MSTDPAPAKSWQARISEATDAIAQTFVESMSYDWRLYKVDVAGSIAHATMLAKVGLITDSDREAIVNGLREIEKEIDHAGPSWPGFRPELEDIHMCVESALTERIGEPGRKLHTGRSRNDQVATDLVLWIHSATHAFGREEFDAITRAFIDLAERSGFCLKCAREIAPKRFTARWAFSISEHGPTITGVPVAIASTPIPLRSHFESLRQACDS